MLIFKIIREKEWWAAKDARVYVGSAHDKEDGFLHFSTAPQLRETLEKHYAQEPDMLVIAAVDDSRFGDELKWETSRSGEPFPHLYAPLPMRAVVGTLATSFSVLQKEDFAGLNSFFEGLAKPVEAHIGASDRAS